VLDQREIVGLLPLAGRATRLSPLPFSKAMYPIGFRSFEDGTVRPKVVCHYLLEKMRLAGIRKAYLALRSGAWDIPTYLGDGAIVDMDLAYLVVRLLKGVPYSLDQAYPFVKDAIVALGFPDILFDPIDGFKIALDHLEQSGSDVVLGVLPIRLPQTLGDVGVDAQGNVQTVLDRSEREDLPYSWYFAVWQPTFTEFLHEQVQAAENDSIPHDELGRAQPEAALGEILQKAIQAGLQISAQVFDDGAYLDIGTPAGLVSAARNPAAYGLAAGIEFK
jgi:glucose-1-phosphate thymidylyltransferase